MTKTLIAALALLAVTGCGTTSQIITKPQIVERPKMTVPTPMAVNQLPVEWVVLTRDNFETKIKEIEAEGGSLVFFAISPQGYQNLSLNIAELRRYIQQQGNIIVTLKEYYEGPQTPEPKKDDKESKTNLNPLNWFSK